MRLFMQMSGKLIITNAVIHLKLSLFTVLQVWLTVINPKASVSGQEDFQYLNLSLKDVTEHGYIRYGWVVD
jgi:hypothetical protein